MGRRGPLGDDLTTLADRVAELLAQPGFAALLGQVRERLETLGRPLRVTLHDLDADARGALADLLGRRHRPAATVTVTIDDLDASLRRSRVGAGLFAVLEAAGGPLGDRRDDARQRRAAWDDVFAELDRRVAQRSEVGGRVARRPELGGEAAPRPDLRAWLAAVRGDGLLKRLAADPDDARRLGAAALDVLERLPADAEPLSVIAAATTGDPHGLDPGAPLATLVLRGAANLTGRDGVPPTARERRQLWSEVGVICDPLSSSVLVLNLRASGSDLVTATLADHAGFGEPVRLTLRQLVNAGSPSWRRADVSVCENPAVMIAAADALADTCRPLVCVEGMPDAAADRLLRALRAAGCALRFHTDFDRGGIRIGNVLAGRYGADPWRMRAPDYADAVGRVARTGVLPPGGAPAVWDDRLLGAMERLGRTVAEEQVLGDLLGDLSAAGTAAGLGG